MSVFLTVGVPMMAVSHRMDRAFYLATSNIHGKITKLLLQAAASMNAIGFPGRGRALQMTSSIDCYTSVRLLLNTGLYKSGLRDSLCDSALRNASEGFSKRSYATSRATARASTKLIFKWKSKSGWASPIKTC